MRSLAEMREALTVLRAKMAELTSTVGRFAGEVEAIRDRVKAAPDEATLAALEVDRVKAAGALEGAKGELASTTDAAKALEDDIASAEKTMADFGAKALVARVETKSRAGNAGVEYLKSPEAMRDYWDILTKNAGADSHAVVKAWKDHLITKDVTPGVNDPEGILSLPSPVITAITDAFEAAGEILATFNQTGLDVFRVGINTEDGEESRARGYNRAKKEEKAEQTIVLDDREARAAFVYKYLTLKREMLRENQNTGALLRYVLTELPQRIVAEIERAAVIGDGRAATSDYKVTSFEAMVDAAAPWADHMVATGNLLFDIVRGRAKLRAPGTRYLVTSKDALADMQLQPVLTGTTSGGLMYPIGTDFAGVAGVGKIFTPDWWDDQSAVKAVLYVGPAYAIVGDRTVESFQNFILAKNRQEFLMETYTGGKLMQMHSALIIDNPEED